MITNDSCQAYFTAFIDRSAFLIFGPDTPAFYGSSGETTPIYAGSAYSPCITTTNHRKTASKDTLGLPLIKPGRIGATIQSGLEKINAASR
jgi:hypothetical protein